MASLDQTAFAAALKTLYPDEAIKNLVYKSNPLMALIQKDEGFVGDSSKEPITIGTPQNRSASFAAAVTVNTTSVIKAFLVTRVSNYSTAAIANETMLSSANDRGAFMSAVKVEMDNALLALSRSIATQMYRSGTGTIARISATANVASSSVAVALAEPEDVVNLELGMSIALSASDGGAVHSGTAYVVNINRSTGTFLCSATVGGAPAALTSLIGSAAANDYIYAAAGDRNAVIKGVKAWLPGANVTATTFFGVDRTIDSRLAGISYDASAQSIEEGLIQAASLIAREGGRPDHCFLSFKDYQKLVLAVSSKQQYIQYSNADVMEPGVTVGFQALILSGPAGPMKVIPDMNAPAGSAFLLQLDTWKLKSLGAAVRIFDGDSLTMIRSATADELLVRCFSYAQMSCRAPGWNCVVTL